MSIIPPPPDTSPPADTPGPVLGPLAPIETAPSAMLNQVPMLTRGVGVAGLFFAVLGAVVVVTTRAIGPRIVPEGLGFISGGVGLALLLYHAVTDTEQEIRRMYGLLAALLLVLGLASAILPGPFDGTGGVKQTGYYLLPWGLGAGMLALLFAIPFVRHETDETLRDIAIYGMLGVGALLCVGIPLAGVGDPDFLAGSGVLLALLGVGFLSAYLGQTDTSGGIGYLVAFVLGALGGALLLYAFGRTVFPTVLYDGPSVLRNPNQSLDRWAAAGRGVVVLAFLGVAALGALGKFPIWLRAVLVTIGLATAGVLIAGTIGRQVYDPPRSFLVPGGLILGFLGTVYIAVSLGVCSDNQFVTLTRRELSAYFLSPIGYLVLGGMAACQWFGYYLFFRRLMAHGRQQVPMPEPIVGEYLLALIPILCVILPVPALTMRLFAEEKRTGSLEVMFTAPVSEWPVVLSKFFATWVFFLICWLPAGLFLIGVRVEAGAGFDYRPLLSFYAALAVCGAAFISCGVFFSAITSNQIVAAVLTFMVILLLVVCYWAKRSVEDLGPTAQAFLSRLSFIDLWQQSLDGQLLIRDVLVWASAAVFGLFLSVKVLEARKWN
jgi:ABC-type transport system involved in multi-copper enzyme maturation permease subunit